VYPGLAVARELSELAPDSSLVYAGRVDEIEARLSQAHGLQFQPIEAAPLRGSSPFSALANGWRLLRGTFRARRALRTIHPDAVFATGGYASVPVVVAAWTLGIPSLVYLPDVSPGLAVRFLGRIATRVAVTADAVTRYFSSRRVLVTGYPVRRELLSESRAEGRARLGIGSGPMLLVMGGSRGAHSINQAVSDSLEALLAQAEVVHVTGPSEHASLVERSERLPEGLRARYHPVAFLDKEMPDALVAADLVVCRAGASVLGELPAVGAPGLLIPYPYAGAHQRLNADYLSSRGAAVVLDDGDVSTQLLPRVRELLGNDATLTAMRLASRSLARPDAGRRLASELIRLAGGAQ
jgi:UDP-N-acetylglucosamine--N-acetylmuramyl-(pentapeptide) pyrophosphoryl-undecaprenol N-acetylglucosamine transferase